MLIADASDLTFLGGIAENQAVFCRAGHELLLDRRVLLLLIQQLIALIHNVHRQPSLMFSGIGSVPPKTAAAFPSLLKYIPDPDMSKSSFEAVRPACPSYGKGEQIRGLYPAARVASIIFWMWISPLLIL